MLKMLISLSIDEEKLRNTFIEQNGSDEGFDLETEAINELGWVADSGISVDEVVIPNVDKIPQYSWITKCAAVQKSIAVVWGTGDVIPLCKDRYGVEITEEQAYDILQSADRKHDANEGINWDVLDIHINMYLDEHGLKQL